MNVTLVHECGSALKRVSKPTFKRSMIIDENLVAMEMYVTKMKMNRPLYVGFAVLDLSKLFMYQFHYEQFTQWFPSASLCFTDTDSLLYHIEADEIVTTLKEHEDFFDFSDYPRDHVCYSARNRKVIGKFKDEVLSLPIVQFVGLRPKCYSILYRGKVEGNVVISYKLDEKMVAKGTKKNIIKRHLHHEHYVDSVDNLNTTFVAQNNILSKDHSLGTYHQSRVSLTAFDTKRWIEADGVNTLAHGHKRTRLV